MKQGAISFCIIWVRLSDNNIVFEVVGQIEHWEHLAEETWKQQVQQITRWTKGRNTRKVVQVAMLAQALRLRGCVEDNQFDSWSRFVDTTVDDIDRSCGVGCLYFLVWTLACDI